MATHSSIPAWKIPWIEEPGRLQFMLEKLVLFSPEVANFLLVGLGSVKQVQKFKERGGKRGPYLPLTLQSPKEMNWKKKWNDEA